MRWFVEISSLGKNASPSATLCVEAPQWQPALQKARALRGDEGALSNFSIELLEDGYRAIDPASRLRYVVRKAPDDAVLTNGTPPGGPPRATGAPSAPPPSASKESESKRRPATVAFASQGAAMVAQPSAPAATKRAAASTMAYSSSGSAAVRDSASPKAARPAPIPSDPVPPAPSHGAPLSYRVLHKREDEPSERSPLTYREYAYAVGEDVGDAAAGAFLLERLHDLVKGLNAKKAGKLVNLAVFDHAFKGRPQRPPIATLSWKDWKGPEPEVRFPLRDGPGNTPTPLAAPTALRPAPAPEPAPAPAPAPKPASEPPARKATSEPPARKAKATPKPGTVKAAGRLSGDELLAELFEAFSDLHFLNDTLAGADFVLALTLEKLPSEVGTVSLFDINKREFVLVRQSGGPRSALLARISEKAPIAQTAMRSHQAVVVRDAASDERAHDERWKSMGVELRSLICAPVEVGGRYLGLIELANPLDNRGFTDGDGHALTYIGQQFAEFVATHGPITDPDQIMHGAKEHR